jgi:RHS repeat-associated protein
MADHAVQREELEIDAPDGDSFYIYGPNGVPVESVGSTDMVAMSTDSTGTIKSTRSYDAWGNVVAHTGDPVSLGWQGQYQDPENGFYYLRHRYYDPATAQFTTPDPLFAMTRSRYGYAANDPVNWSDPLGLFGFGTIASEFQGIVGGIGPFLNTIGSSIEGAAGWVSKNPAADITFVSIGVCIATGGGWCAAITAAAFAVRASVRYRDDGWSGSWKANLLDFALTGATLGTGELVESGIEGSTMSVERGNIYGTRAVESGLGIGMFAGDQLSGGDMLKRAFP